MTQPSTPMANRGDSRLGHRVRVIRQAMDLKQGPFGAFFGRDAATVSRYESGKIPLHPETVATINYLAGLVIARIGQEEFAVRLADVPAPQPRRGYSRTRTPSAGYAARWIHETLGDSGMTAEELAGIIKISASQLSRYRSRKSDVPEEVIRRIVKATKPSLTAKQVMEAVEQVKERYPHGHGRPGHIANLNRRSVPRGKRLSQSLAYRTQGHRIGVIRRALGLSQKECAELLGCGAAMLSGYELGRVGPPPEVSALIETLAPEAIRRLGQDEFDAQLAVVPPVRQLTPSQSRVLPAGHMGNWIKAALKRGGRTATSVAGKLGIAPSTFSRYQSGEIAPPTKIVPNLIEALGLPDDPEKVTTQYSEGYAAPRSSNAPSGTGKRKSRRK